MPLETSPEHPAPVRQITQAIGQWIDRLGAVWVEGHDSELGDAIDERRLDAGAIRDIDSGQAFHPASV